MDNMSVTILSHYCYFPKLHTSPLAVFKHDSVAGGVHILSVKMLLFSEFADSNLYSHSDAVLYPIEINSGKDVIISDS